MVAVVTTGPLGDWSAAVLVSWLHQWIDGSLLCVVAFAFCLCFGWPPQFGMDYQSIFVYLCLSLQLSFCLISKTFSRWPLTHCIIMLISLYPGLSYNILQLLRHLRREFTYNLKGSVCRSCLIRLAAVLTSNRATPKCPVCPLHWHFAVMTVQIYIKYT